MFKRPLGIIVGMAMVGVSLIGWSGQSAVAGDHYSCFDEQATIIVVSPVTNGTSKRDVIYVPVGGPVTVHGKGGNDLICSDNAYATVYGDTGDDSLYGLGALYGDSGNDFLTPYDYRGPASIQSVNGELSSMSGGSGNDAIEAQFVAFVDGGSGNDEIYGNVVGEIRAGSGNDYIRAEYVDAVYADSGNDISLIYGSDLLDCGSGLDTYVTLTNFSQRVGSSLRKIVGGLLGSTDVLYCWFHDLRFAGRPT